MALDLTFLETTTSAATVSPLVVSIDLLDEDPDQPRKEFIGIDEMAADIEVRGILQPIVVRPPVNGRYTIRFGARRYRGAKLAKLSEVPIYVSADPRQFDDYAQVAENRQRAPLTPLEEAAFINKRLAAGEKRKDIAKSMNVTASAITALSSLIDPPAFILELYQSGKCTAADYLYRLRSLHEVKPDLVVDKVATAPEITRRFIDELAEIVNGAPKQPKAPVEPPNDASVAEGQSKPETAPKPPVASDKTRYNVIMVKHQGQSAQLLLDRRAQTVGLGWIKHLDDGHETEVVLTDCTLDALLEK